MPGAVGRVRETESLQQSAGDRWRIGQPQQPGDQQQVLASGQDLIHGGELAGQAQGPADLGGILAGCRFADPGSARIGGQQGVQDPHECRLAGAIGAEQGEDAARLHGEVQ